jgi:hypothetical protein
MTGIIVTQFLHYQYGQFWSEAYNKLKEEKRRPAELQTISKFVLKEIPRKILKT